MKVCRQCAKKGEKVYMKTARRALSVIIYICPKCKERVMIDRKT